jgi:hypothetical protein
MKKCRPGYQGPRSLGLCGTGFWRAYFTCRFVTARAVEDLIAPEELAKTER